MHSVSLELRCGEELALNDADADDLYYDEDIHLGPITFHITLPTTSATTTTTTTTTTDDDDIIIVPSNNNSNNNNNNNRRLLFNCRDRSCGVLLSTEPTVPPIALNGRVVPFFFEPGFSLEAMTGFQVWPGSRLVVEAFTCNNNNNNNNKDNENIANTAIEGGDCAADDIVRTVSTPAVADAPSSPSSAASALLREWQQQQLLLTTSTKQGDGAGTNILEVGAGMGVVGTCLAAAGGNVIVTDLSILVEHGIRPNLRRNRNNKNENECSNEGITTTTTSNNSSNNGYDDPPSFLVDITSVKESSSDNDDDDAGDFDDPIPIGKGWANTTALDWFLPISTQLSFETISSIDIIIGCDCLFLKKLIDPLLSVISDIFAASAAASASDSDAGASTKSPPKFLFTYERRNMMGLFISLEDLLEKIKERGWTVECLAWRTVAVEGDGEHDLHLFQVSSSESESE